jgi:perosamine synthetase
VINQVGIKVREREKLESMLLDIVDSTWFSEGKYCEKYLDLIREKIGSRHCFLAPNGTLGLFLALSAFKDEHPKGDVLVPSFTFYGSASSIVFAGYNPVFVDCSPVTFQSTLEDFKDAWTENTVGIMPVHIYGQIGEIEEICSWAREENLFSVEDAAQAFSGKKNGHSAGTFADIGVFSTFSDKIYTTGEGAIITAQTDDLAEKIKLMRNQGRPNAGSFTHPEHGMNFRMTEFQAALGYHQLSYLEDELKERREKYSYYQEKIKGIDGLLTMGLYQGSTLIPFRFPILSDCHAEHVTKLESAKVQTRNFFVPMHMQPKFIEGNNRSLPNAELISTKGICLPIHHGITKENIDYIVSALS